MRPFLEIMLVLILAKAHSCLGRNKKRHSLQARTPGSDRTPIGLIRVLNMLFPGTGPGGNFKDGSVEATLGELSRAQALINKIARTQVRLWMETELGSEFGLDRSLLNPSLQIEIKPNRPLPNASLKWNKVTKGTTNPLRIEDATVKYLNERLFDWGNNRSPNNDYVQGSTLSRGFETPSKSVYFDHLSGDENVPIAHEAFTGPAPGASDIRAWTFLANRGVVKPGMIFNFQNELGQAISESSCNTLVNAGYQVSVVPYDWWSSYIVPSDIR